MSTVDNILRVLITFLVIGLGGCADPESRAPSEPAEPILQEPPAPVVGVPGGRLVAALRAEPGTLNPVLAFDRPSALVSYLTSADLIHIDRESQEVEPSLAERWTISEDGKLYTLELRQGVLFSDGEPFDADDVLFSFQVYLDPEVASTNRSLLMVHGEPIEVEKLDSHTVAFRLAGPYAVGVRLFDNVAMLPEHQLGPAYAAGELATAWTLGGELSDVVGLGPFRPAGYRPGESLTLARNDHYWRQDAAGGALPYLDEIVLRFVTSEDAEALRFQNGETDVVQGISAANFEALLGASTSSRFDLTDLGPGLAFNFLFFNLNDLSLQELPEVQLRQRWYRQVAFRQAVSEVIDRDAIARLVYRGRARAAGGPVAAGNRLWRNERLSPPERSIEGALSRLEAIGFELDPEGTLRDADGEPVRFTIVTNSSNRQRVQIATILQEDLRQVGITVQVVPLEFQSLVRRLLETHDYDACVLGLGGGDVDPNSWATTWPSSGSRHLWAPRQETPATPWEAEIDRLMLSQLTELDRVERKRQYDRVQELLVENLPLIYLVSPSVLVGADRNLRNFRPAILEPSTLWNADRLFWPQGSKNID